MYIYIIKDTLEKNREKIVGDKINNNDDYRYKYWSRKMRSLKKLLIKSIF